MVKFKGRSTSGLVVELDPTMVQTCVQFLAGTS